MPSDRVVTRPFVLTCAVTFIGFLTIGALLPTLPLYAHGPLGAGSVGVGLAVGASSLFAIVAQPPAGRLADRRGRRLLLIGGPLIMAASTGVLALDPPLVPLVVLRLLNGAGEGALLVGSITTVNDLAPDARRGEAVSLWTLAPYGGLAIGPLLGELALGDDRFDAVWLVAAAL